MIYFSELLKEIINFPVGLRAGVLTLLSLLLSISSFSAEHLKTHPSLNRIIIRVSDLKAQSDWYQTTFKFFKIPNRDLDKAILKKNDFVLELVQQKSVITMRNLQLPDQMKYLSGFSKFGFAINQLDDLFAHLKQQNIETMGGIFHDKNLNFRTFIVKDPEGNLIQFFEPRGPLRKFRLKNDEWKACFLMIITDNHQRTINWYQNKLQFREVGNIDDPSRNVIHRTFFNGGILLELAEISGKIVTPDNYPEVWKNAGGIISIGLSKTGKKEKLTFDDNFNRIDINQQ